MILSLSLNTNLELNGESSSHWNLFNELKRLGVEAAHIFDYRYRIATVLLLYFTTTILPVWP